MAKKVSNTKTITGISIPIELSTTRMDEDIKRLKSELDKAAETMIRTLDQRLDTKKAVTNFANLYKSIGSVRDAAKALNTVKTGDFMLGLSTSQKELLSLARTFGITTENQKKFMQEIYKTQAIEQETSAMRTLSKATGKAGEEFLEFARARGLAFTKEATEAFFKPKDVEAIEKYTASYKELVALAGAEISKEGLKSYVDTNRIKEAVDATKKLNDSQIITKKNVEDIARATNTTTEQVLAYVKAMDKASKSDLGAGVSSRAKQIQKYIEDFRELSRLSGAEFSRSNIKEYIDTKSIEESIRAAKRLNSDFDFTEENILRIAEASKTSFGQVKTYIESTTKSTTQEKTTVEKLTERYKELAAVSGSLATTAGLKKFIDENLIKDAVNATKQLNNGQKLTKQQFIEIAQATNTTTEQVKAYVAQMEKAQRASRNLFVSAFTPSNIVAGLQSGASAFGIVGGAYGIAELVKSSYQASMKIENLSLAFRSVYDSAEIAGQKMEFVKRISDELGLSVLSTAEGAKKLFAAAKGTVLEDEAENIIEAFSTMGAALKLTGSEMDSVFLAISQMLSKGKVSAEELRLQLAERMPGAVTLFARAIGVSTAKLDDMLQKGQVGLAEFSKFADLVQITYAQGAMEASSGLQAELNRLSNTWLEFKTGFVDTEATASFLRGVRETLDTFSAFTPALMTLASLMTGLAEQAVVVGAAFGALRLAVKAVDFTRFIVEAVEVNGVLGSTKKAATAAKDAFSSFILTANGATLALSGVTAILFALATRQTEAEKILHKYGTGVESFIEKANEFKIKTDDMTESVRKLKEELAEGAAQDFETLVEGASGTLLKRSSSFLGIGGAYTAPYVTEFQAITDSLNESLTVALEKGFSNEQIKRIKKKYEDAYVSLYIRADADERVSETFVKELATQAVAVTNSADVYIKKTKEMLDAVEVVERTQKGLSNFDQSRLDVTLKSIERITGETSLGKLVKDAENFQTLVKDFVTFNQEVYNASEYLKTGGDSVDKIRASQEAMSKTRDEAQKLVGYLIDNGKSLDDFSEEFLKVGRAAGLGEEQLNSFLATVKQVHQEASKTNLSDFVEGLRIDLLESDFTTPVQKIAEQLQKQGALNEYAELLYIVNTGQYKLLRGIQLTTEAQDIFNRTVALGNKKSGSSKKSDFEKLFESLTSFNERYTEKSMTDIEKAANDFKAVYADVDKFIASGKGTDTQRQKLLALVSTLKMTEQAYIDQLRAKEAQEKAETRAEEFRRFNAEFAEVMGSEREARLANIDEWYDEERARWQSLLIGKIVDAEEYNEKLTQLEQMYNMKRMEESTAINDQMKLTLKSWFDEYENTAPQIADFTVDAFRTAADAIGDFAASGLRDIDSLGDAFSNMADQMLQTAARMFSNQMFSSMFQWIGGGTSIGSWFSGLFSAKGNVFSNSPDLHKFSNSVISKPTLFNYGTHVKAYAKGAGLMGEAGPEAVVPLVRTSSGHLGVRTVGNNGGTNVYVNVINKSDAQVTTRESQDNQGNTNIEFLIEKHVGNAMKRPGSDPYRALNNTYGANMRLANR